MAQIPSEANPSAPEGAAPAPGGPEASGSGGKIASLMSETFKNLSMLAELVTAAGDEAMAQKIQAVKTQFENILGDDGGEQPGGDQAPAQGGALPMEAGAAKVRPAL